MQISKIFRSKRIIKYLFPCFILIYFATNLLFLTGFPYIHSDEAWLSGLSRVFINTLKMDYTFFDLFPTTHHTMKIFFLLIQGIFIKVLGYNIFTLRLISIIFSTGSLIIYYKILLNYSKNRIISLMFTVILSLNLQWIMVSHIARQEAILIFLFLLAYYLLLKKPKYEVLILSTILGFGIGIHPNIFFLAIALGLTYLYQWVTRKRSFIDLVKLVGITALYTFVYLITTFTINSNFLSEYHAYGNKLGVFSQITNKFKNFYYFYYKLYHRISGTYFTVSLNYDYLAFIILIALLIILYFKNRKKLDLHIINNNYFSIVFFISMNIGILILGRYNQISIIFPIIFLYMCLAVYTLSISENRKILVYILSIIIIFQCYHSYSFINQINNESYEELLNKFSVVSEEGNVLANLNLEYKFQDRLIDYRNLTHLKDASISIKEYIEKNNIKYIIWYEEMDYIYRNQPKWDILYGSLNYYEEIKEYIDLETKNIKSFESPTYAMRIAKYVNTYPWEVKIYEVKE